MQIWRAFYLPQSLAWRAHFRICTMVGGLRKRVFCTWNVKTARGSQSDWSNYCAFIWSSFVSVSQQIDRSTWVSKWPFFWFLSWLLLQSAHVTRPRWSLWTGDCTSKMVGPRMLGGKRYYGRRHLWNPHGHCSRQVPAGGYWRLLFMSWNLSFCSLYSRTRRGK